MGLQTTVPGLIQYVALAADATISLQRESNRYQ
jgi:hypothetical protein